MTYQSINPFDGKLLKSFEQLSDQQLDKKNSGYGRELSSLGIHEFLNKKLVRVDSINAPA